MMRILLLDDEPDFGDLTKTMLEFNDFEVQSFEDPRTALAHLDQETRPYQVIVTDLMMPHMSGFDVINHVRKLALFAKTPVIVLTAKTLTDDERKFLLQNNAHFMVKPFEPHGLVDMIKSVATLVS